MADIPSIDPSKIRDALNQPGRINDSVMLAGSALAQPMLAVRSRQAQMEAIRTAARLGADHPETRARQAQAEQLATRREQMAANIEVQRLPRPASTDQAGLFGRVTKDGAPCPGLAVGLLDDSGATLAHDCTGRGGEYSLSFSPSAKARVEIRDADKPLFRDSDPSQYPAYRPTHRDIELSDGKPVCPHDPPTQPDTRVEVPRLIGMADTQAASALKSLGLEQGNVTRKPGAQAGLVLDQKPAAGTRVAPGSSVDLVISATADHPTALPDLEGCTLDDAVSEVRKAGGKLGSVHLHPGGGRTAKVRAARARDDDDGVHLDVSIGASEAAQTAAIASVLASTDEAAGIGVSHKEGATAWLKEYRLTTVERITEVVTLEDDGLRDWFGLDAGSAVGAVRDALGAADRLIRKL